MDVHTASGRRRRRSREPLRRSSVRAPVISRSRGRSALGLHSGATPLLHRTRPAFWCPSVGDGRGTEATNGTWMSPGSGSRYPVWHHEQPWPPNPHRRGTGPRSAIDMACGLPPARVAGPRRRCRSSAPGWQSAATWGHQDMDIPRDPRRFGNAPDRRPGDAERTRRSCVPRLVRGTPTESAS
jgi:hypothetical protein